MVSIGFIGAGQMAEAIATGFINRGGVPRYRIHFCDVAPPRIKIFKDLGANHCENGIALAKNARLIFVAVKPYTVSKVLTEIRSVLDPSHIIVSIAAGITISHMLSVLGDEAKVIRIMPNTPCLVGETAAAMCIGGSVRSSFCRSKGVRSVGERQRRRDYKRPVFFCGEDFPAGRKALQRGNRFERRGTCICLYDDRGSV